jgi:hypothetical protein
MKTKLFRLLIALTLLMMSMVVTGCDPDFYLSESETAAYAALLSSESDANSFISNSLPGQVLTITFNNASSPPTIQSTNLVPLLRSYTTLGLVEGINRQIQLDRLNAQLQTQIERWLQSELKLYTGVNGAGASLTQLSSISVIFLNKPVFTFRPDRQSIAFSANVRLIINGTVRVDALDFFSNLLFQINGTYPLTVDIKNFGLNGEAALRSPFMDSGTIGFTITPSPGSVTVSPTAGSVPTAVTNGVRSLVSAQLSRTLRKDLDQRYDYFALTGLGLTPNTAQAPSQLQYTYQARPLAAKPMLHIVARASDGKLYHMRKTEGGQSLIATVLPFPSLTASIQNEPALFASATDQLELAATTVSSDLVYAHWRDEFWGYQFTFAAASSASAGYRGKPAILASAPGQVEIVASGRDGGLWHLRRLNGRWLPAALIPLSQYSSIAAPPFRDPVAVQAGNKVVVVFADALNRLLAVAFDFESGVWGEPTWIQTQETVRFAPAAVASGDMRVEVVYAGQSGTPYHRVLDVQSARFPSPYVTGISIVGSEVTIGGVLNAAPILVCSSYKQLEVIGRGTDNRLYHNHYVGPASPFGYVYGRTISTGWQGWTDLNGNFSGSLTFELMNGFSAASTSSGKIVTASVMQPWVLDPNTNQFIFHNTFDSNAYGSQPWNTVLWRGYEQVGAQRFIGQPALAVTDRQTALAYVGNTFTTIGASMSDANSGSFGTFDTTSISQPPADPLVVSAVPGEYDIFEVGSDGRLRHTRRSSRGSSFTYAFSAVGGQLFRAQPAVVGYGSGQLEMVAVAQNNSLYFWRYQNGTWSSGVQIPGFVISQPVLAYVGAGQMVLLAIGGDRKMYMWSFTNGAWSAYAQVPTSFTINNLYFGRLAASSWGDGSLDVGLVDSQTGALNHGRIGPGYFTTGIALGLTPSKAFTSLGGILVDTPILTAFSPTRINILAVGTDSNVYSTWSSPNYSQAFLLSQAPPIVWSGYSYIGGNRVLLGGVAKLGANELTAAGIDSSGRLSLARFNGAKWMQFEPVIGQVTGSLLAPPMYRPAVTTLN